MKIGTSASMMCALAAAAKRSRRTPRRRGGSSDASSAVGVDSLSNVYVFQRGKKADPLIVFDSTGKYLLG